MVAIVLADALSRILFGLTGGGIDLTFVGGVELVSYALLFTIAFTLPFSLDRGQVMVDLFTQSWPQRARAAADAVYFLGFAALGFGMAWKFYEGIGRTAASGQTTQDLGVPLYQVYGLAAFAAFVLGLRALVVAADLALGRAKPL